MNSLLTSLVERSVRNAVRDEPLPSRSADPGEERAPSSASMSTPPRGVIRPRLRSRHEPRLDGDRFDVESIEDIIDRLPSRASDARQPDVPPSQPDVEARLGGGPRRHTPVHREQSPSRDFTSPVRGIERRPKPQADAEAPSEAEAAPISESAHTEPRPRDARVTRVPPPTSPDRRAPAMTFPENRTNETAPERGSIARDMSPSRQIDPLRQPRLVTATVGPRAEPMTETHATRHSSPVRGGALRPPRDAPRVADVIMRPAAVERPSAPRVEITIGRVEVRAVYAPPPALERKAAVRPMTSLDEYLKQRDKPNE